MRAYHSCRVMRRRLLPFAIRLVVSAEVSLFAPLVNRVQQALNTGVQGLRLQMTAWTKPTTTSLARGSLRDLVRTKPPLIPEHALRRQPPGRLPKAHPPIIQNSLTYPGYV